MARRAVAALSLSLAVGDSCLLMQNAISSPQHECAPRRQACFCSPS